MQFDVFSFPWLCTSGSVGSRWNFHQPGSLGNCDEQTSLPTHGRRVAYVQNMLCWVKQKQQQQTKIQTDWLVSWCLSLCLWSRIRGKPPATLGRHSEAYEGTPQWGPDGFGWQPTWNRELSTNAGRSREADLLPWSLQMMATLRGARSHNNPAKPLPDSWPLEAARDNTGLLFEAARWEDVISKNNEYTRAGPHSGFCGP